MRTSALSSWEGKTCFEASYSLLSLQETYCASLFFFCFVFLSRVTAASKKLLKNTSYLPLIAANHKCTFLFFDPHSHLWHILLSLSFTFSSCSPIVIQISGHSSDPLTFHDSIFFEKLLSRALPVNLRRGDLCCWWPPPPPSSSFAVALVAPASPLMQDIRRLIEADSRVNWNDVSRVRGDCAIIKSSIVLLW